MAGKSPARKQSEGKIQEFDRDRGKARVAAGGELGELYEKWVEASQAADQFKESYLERRESVVADSVFTEEELVGLGWPDLTPTGKPKRPARAEATATATTVPPEPAPPPHEPPADQAQPAWGEMGGEPQHQHTDQHRIEEYA